MRRSAMLFSHATAEASIAGLPDTLRHVFWNDDFAALDEERDEVHILARVLEHGRLVDVQWVLSRYGPERIHRFFVEVGHPEISPRTIGRPSKPISSRKRQSCCVTSR